MIQDILTYATVTWAFVYSTISLWRMFVSTSSKKACSSGCSSCSDKKFLIAAMEKKIRVKA